MRKLTVCLWALGLVPASMAGCLGPTPPRQWDPSKQEMRMLMGNTVMQALHQYQQNMKRAIRKAPRDNVDPRFPDKPLV